MVAAHKRFAWGGCLLRSMVLLRDASGAVQGCASIMRDVTAQWKKEKDLHERLAACEEAAGTTG